MARIRTLIADDEPLARDRLRAFLELEQTIELIGESRTGPETTAAIRTHTPDLVILDLHMPGYDGLAVVTDIQPEIRPAIIFVTAHERHAVDAFHLGAVDYLLKPFDRERLQQALHRADEYLRARRAAVIEARLKQVLHDSGPQERRPERFAIKTKGRVVFIAPADIVRIDAADNYVAMRLLGGERVMLRESLTAMEERLGTAHFARVNRSTLVRRDLIRELRSTPSGDYVVILRDGTKLPLSRNLRGRFDVLAGEEA